MKATGIIRKLDPLGRVVLPIKLRNNLKLEKGNFIEIFTKDDFILLKKYNPTCTFCNEEEIENLINYKDKKICKKCLKELMQND